MRKTDSLRSEHINLYEEEHKLIETTWWQAYIPTVFENYVTQVHFDGKQIELALWDTAGQEEYDSLRPLSYLESNVILVVFSVDFPTSLANVLDKVIQSAPSYCPLSSLPRCHLVVSWSLPLLRICPANTCGN